MDSDVEYLEHVEGSMTWDRFRYTYLRMLHNIYIDEIRDTFTLVNHLPLSETSGRYCIWICRNKSTYVGFDRKFGWFYSEVFSNEFIYVDSSTISNIVCDEYVRTETGINKNLNISGANNVIDVKY